MKPRKFKIPGTLLVVTGWTLAIGALHYKMNAYSYTQGVPAQSDQQWPDRTAIPLNPKQDTLLVFIHPKCACSRATLGELNRLLPEIKSSMATTILFHLPKGQSKDWHRGKNWEIANELPGVSIVIDAGGDEMRRFRVHASGQALLYSSSGRLLFSGGLTPARGHSGDSVGRQALLSRAQTGRIPTTDTPVYGCALESKHRSGEGQIP